MMARILAVTEQKGGVLRKVSREVVAAVAVRRGSFGTLARARAG